MRAHDYIFPNASSTFTNMLPTKPARGPRVILITCCSTVHLTLASGTLSPVLILPCCCNLWHCSFLKFLFQGHSTTVSHLFVFPRRFRMEKLSYSDRLRDQVWSVQQQSHMPRGTQTMNKKKGDWKNPDPPTSGSVYSVDSSFTSLLTFLPVNPHSVPLEGATSTLHHFTSWCRPHPNPNLDTSTWTSLPKGGREEIKIEECALLLLN